MSIYCTNFDIGFEHNMDHCSKFKKLEENAYKEDDSKPCTCGAAPILYQGSHILPHDDDERGGVLSFGSIPPHITRDGRDDAPDNGKLKPWLRVSVDVPNGSTCILTRNQVLAMRDALNEWLNDS